ncbi:MAG: membrane-bound O-acyltransferase family protein [Crocinitomicaceae bacterium]|nr:membrane-bound O-acyltransferase family protein [Crocinitomicaceae bacterium]
MLFNSFDFAVFLPITFVIYWFICNKNTKFQNFFLIISSYIFYGWWDWRFLILIIFSSFLDYYLGIQIDKSKNQRLRKTFLFLSLFFNLGLLGIFKYYNFFAVSFTEAFSLFGSEFRVNQLKIILPVGISFYTFQTLSYTFDIYKNKIKPTKDIFSFFAFVCFFPQLVAGPIERAANLLPQFIRKRTFNFDNAKEGLRQGLFGLFKKVVIADNCAIYANNIFENYEIYPGSTLILGAIFFTFQIYCDFSGYSDIAIGTSKLFGFNLKQNFAYPYFSRNIAEFWRRWHISLSTWFRDYLYIPIGGSKGSKYNKIKNTFIIFIVSGFWHGANWTFIFWGAANALLFLPLLLFNKNRNYIEIVAKETFLPNFRELTKIVCTFSITSLIWVIFRSESIFDTINYYSIIFSDSIFSYPFIIEEETNFQFLPKTIFVLIFVLISIDWLGRKKTHPLKKLELNFKKPTRWLIYSTLCFLIFIFKADQQDFIYFQF